MRKIERKIIDALHNNKELRLSSRDETSKGKTEIAYYLHGSALFVKSYLTGKRAIFLSAIGAVDSPISATTKSRLNAILDFYDMPKIRQKNFELFFNEEKLKVNGWYRLDCVNQKLIPMERFSDLYR